MNSLILCEGKTDAIIISYYLSKSAVFRGVKKAHMTA